MAQRPTAKDAYREGKLPLPPGYGLEHGAGALLLRREDGSVAATFSAGGSAPSEVARTAEEDQKRIGKRPTRDRPPRKMRGQVQEQEGRPGRAPLGAEEAGGRCWHRGYPVVVGRVDGGRTARCLGCGRSGPARPSAAGALAALRDEARRSFEETV